MTAPTDRPRGWLTAFLGIARRETLRFVNQRGRFLAALVRAGRSIVVSGAQGAG